MQAEMATYVRSTLPWELQGAFEDDDDVEIFEEEEEVIMTRHVQRIGELNTTALSLPESPAGSAPSSDTPLPPASPFSPSSQSTPSPMSGVLHSSSCLGHSLQTPLPLISPPPKPGQESKC